MMTRKKSHISFTKMQGAGNDFVVLNNLEDNYSRQELIELTPKLCDRKFGIGADGLLALFPPEAEKDDYIMFYRNADGSDAGMCGNGARCLARFAHTFGFDEQQKFSVHNARYKAEIIDKQSVRIHFPGETSIRQISLDDQAILKLHTGTEHIVIVVEQQALEQEEKLRQKGQSLRYHDSFKPKGTNVNFICGLDNDSLQLQTYERGVEDLTLACGTGAIASALAWHYLQEALPAARPFNVRTKGGRLQVFFSFDKQHRCYTDIKLEGPVETVFDGQFLI
ncbi:MAG TPA: diaminopimelate epimerase [Fodinibius sp.]|nr:diaminopimelate epimerase [Fodinibius sp.]